MLAGSSRAEVVGRLEAALCRGLLFVLSAYVAARLSGWATNRPAGPSNRAPISCTPMTRR